MFRDEKGLEVEYREKMRGGDGTVAIRHLFPKDELGPHCRMMARITLPPGASIGPHDHTGERELYHIIRGKACLEENGKTYTMVPVILPSPEEEGFMPCAISDEPLSYSR